MVGFGPNGRHGYLDHLKSFNIYTMRIENYSPPNILPNLWLTRLIKREVIVQRRTRLKLILLPYRVLV